MSGLSVSDRMHEAAAPVWAKCLDHPFVRGIGDGTLDVEKFKFFMMQDYLYLFDYAKVFALGIVKARDHDLMRTFAMNLEAVLNSEMKTHQAYMKRLGISEEEILAVRPALDNLSYTNYLLSVASTGTPMEIVASVLACSWSYAEIGQALAQVDGALKHPFYGAWVRSYADAQYSAVNDALIALMNDLAKDASEEQVKYLTEIFVNCSRYELGFWDMAWEMRM